MAPAISAPRSREGACAGEPSRALFVQRELFGQLEFFLSKLFDIDVFEREYFDGLDEAVGSINIPHPHIGECQLEVEVAAHVTHNLLDLIGQIKPSLGFNDVLKLRHHVAVLAVQGELNLAVVIFEIVIVHGVASLDGQAQPEAEAEA
jgi:hypothetical protein